MRAFTLLTLLAAVGIIIGYLAGHSPGSVFIGSGVGMHLALFIEVLMVEGDL